MKITHRLFALLAVVLFAAPVVLAESDAEWRARVDAELKKLRDENEATKRENMGLKQKMDKQEKVTREIATSKSVDAIYGRAMGAGAANTAYLASGHPDVKGWGIVFTGDFLYWKPQQGQLTYASTDDNIFGAGSNFPRGEAESVEFDWSAGFRLGAGYRLPWDAWDVRATYTYFRSDSHAAVADASDRLHALYWNDNEGNDDADLAEAHIDLDYDVFDLELGRPFKFSETVTIRPFGGLRMAWLKNDARFNYFGDNFPTIAASRLGGQVTDHSDFFGYGIRLGAEGNLKLKYGFSLYGKAEASLLTGKFSLHTWEAEDDGGGGGTAGNSAFEPGEIQRRIRQDIHRVVPVVQVAAGAAWDRKLLDSLNLQVSLGYEFVNYFNTINRRRFVGDDGDAATVEVQDNLGFHGLVFRVKLDF